MCSSAQGTFTREKIFRRLPPSTPTDCGWPRAESNRKKLGGQIHAYGTFCDLSLDQSAGTAAAAGDFGFMVLTSSNPAEKTKKLSAELANGRLAMMAIIGMFFQIGLTGSARGDCALYTASPLRAFENEFVVQAPVGSVGLLPSRLMETP